MSGDQSPTHRIDSLVLWLLVTLGTAFLLRASGMVPSRLSLLLVAALLALGGVLLLTVEWFLLYFGSEPGRLFG